MPTGTTHYNIQKPDIGQSGWAPVLNTAIDSVDTIAYGLAAHSALNSGDIADNPATPTIDLSRGRIIYLPLTVSVTSCTLTNLTDGYVTFLIAQPVAGNCEFTWPTQCKFAGAISAVAETVSGSTISVQTFAVNSTLGKAYASSLLNTGVI